MLMQAVAFQYAFHPVNMPVFCFDRHACNAVKIVGMVSVRRNSIKYMDMKITYAKHITGTPQKPVVMAFGHLAVEFVSVQVKFHAILRVPSWI
jgi:hypothetical protein